jgi:hypothetical protein
MVSAIGGGLQHEEDHIDRILFPDTLEGIDDFKRLFGDILRTIHEGQVRIGKSINSSGWGEGA